MWNFYNSCYFYNFKSLFGRCFNSSTFYSFRNNAKALCNHRRNLTDEQIKAIASRDGVIGVNAYKHFI
ncbi:membrane dipeptidase, partial [Fusobacterium mortiferum]|uniref:membrane dipeptidase n=1 Tax=Fusobacterium mortiferum TaxID=850 RepID=UPI0030B8832F